MATVTGNIESKRNLLVMDDDRHFLEVLVGLAQAWSKDTWKLHPAPNSARALAILQEQAMDLAIIDINMPVVDGLQVLRIFNEKYPQIKKVILTGYADEEKRHECLSLGADLFLEKPRTPDGYETMFAMLRELLESRAEQGFRGMLRRVGLEDIIQMECLARKSSVLEISDAQVRGQLYIEDGSIVHAATGEQKGQEAFNTLLMLTGGEFKLRQFEPPSERSIEGQWEFLLMEAARVRDERSAAAGPEQATPAMRAPSVLAHPDEAAQAVAQDKRLEELVICSDQGTVRFQMRCADADGRAKLFLKLRPKAQMMTQLLRVGAMERMEFQGGKERGLVILDANRSVLVRVAQRGDAGAEVVA